jgi:hypothetical protein
VHRGGYDPEQHLKDMELDGVAGEVLFPSQGLFYFKVADTPLMSAIFRAYNDWLADFCIISDRRATSSRNQRATSSESASDHRQFFNSRSRGVTVTYEFRSTQALREEIVINQTAALRRLLADEAFIHLSALSLIQIS